MNVTWSVLHAPGLDVYRHLAGESVWLSDRGADSALVIFWRSRRAVVIGKNQNPWREVRVGRLREERCDLARRVTGGGAVFHDEGNLNVSVIMPRRAYRREQVFAWFCDVFSRLGLNAHFIGQTNLGVESRKVSGHAFAFRGQAVLHHATVLVNAELDVMENLLRKDESRVNTHAVSSTLASVANLCEWIPRLEVETVVGELEKAVVATWGPPRARWNNWPVELQDAIDRRTDELRSWCWVFGQTPPFSAQWDCYISDMRLVGQVRVVEGIVEESDLILVRPRGEPMALPLKGARFAPDDFMARLEKMGLAEDVRSGLSTTLIEV